MPRSPHHLIGLPGFAACLLLIATMFSEPAIGQSFDCQKARSPDEVMICQDSGLARLDQALAEARRQRGGKLSKERREEFEEHEIPFVNARRRCREDRGCIAQSYRNRLRELDRAMPGNEGERSSRDRVAADEKRSQRHRQSQGSGSERQPALSGSSAETPTAQTSADEPPASPPSPDSLLPRHHAQRADKTKPAAPDRAEHPSAATGGSGSTPWVNPLPSR